MASTDCTVCFETFSEVGNKCPKLLPCSHTLCLECLTQITRGTQVQCPECRQFHQVPIGGAEAFPTNRYLLDLFQVVQSAAQLFAHQLQENDPTVEKIATGNDVIMCGVHQKPCVMFCMAMECWQPLCPSCPIQNHPNHKLVSFTECVQDSEELEQIKQEIAIERSCLAEYKDKINEAKTKIAKEAQDAQDTIDRRLNSIVLQAEKLKQQIQDKSNEEQKKLETIQGNIETYSCIGQQIEFEIDMRPIKVLSESVRHLSDIMNQFINFRQSSFQERSTTVQYEFVRLKNSNSQIIEPDFFGTVEINRREIQNSVHHQEEPYLAPQSTPQQPNQSAEYEIPDPFGMEPFNPAGSTDTPAQTPSIFLASEFLPQSATASSQSIPSDIPSVYLHPPDSSSPSDWPHPPAGGVPVLPPRSTPDSHKTFPPAPPVPPTRNTNKPQRSTPADAFKKFFGTKNKKN